MSLANLTRNQLRMVICLSLALVTAALYWPMTHHEFVNLDDESYITDNPQVTAGLTGPGITWAFRTGYAANWHPLTWISHMLDCQLYGVNPAGHHLTNLLFHIANSLLLFLWLSRLTGTVWRSALVAALFAWHPVHVESVAWVAERKDVLSAFFWLLTLIAYTRYAHKRSNGEKPGATLDYLLALFFFACGLMSKPMVVTLPFVLLLLDYWPLARCSCFRPQVSGPEQSSTLNPQLSTKSVFGLIYEKLPFFALAGAGCVVTFLAQKGGGAVWSSGLPLPARIANALVSYMRYISKTFWPADLAVVYPYPHYWPTTLVLGAILGLAFWTGFFLWRARQNPFLIIGWLWFLGTLVPVTGIIQVGPQSMADRYLYLPGIGLFILTVWVLAHLANLRPGWRPAVVLLAMAALAGCLVCTRIQLSFWQNSLTLLRHAVSVTTDNYIACNFLGRALDDTGKTDESLPWYEESVRIEPHYPEAQFNLGRAWLYQGKPEAAGEHLAAAVKLVPDDAGARYYLGMALLNDGRLNEATEQFTEAVRLDPGLARAHSQLALALIKQGKTMEAIFHFSRAVRLQPDDAGAHFNLGLALLDNRQPAEAAVEFAEELRLSPNETRGHYRLAQALQQQNQWGDAIHHYREALRLMPEFPEAKRELEEILAAHPDLR